MGSSQTRDRSCVSCVGRRIFYHWATREAQHSHFLIENCDLSQLEIVSEQTPKSKTHKQVFKWSYFLLLLLSCFSRVRLCATPQSRPHRAHQAPPSLGFSRQEHWSGLPFPSPTHESEKWKWSCSVVFNPQRPHGLQPTRLPRPWDFPGKSTGVGCHCPLPTTSAKYSLTEKNLMTMYLLKYEHIHDTIPMEKIC